mgnify:CR=1 FL=1
MAMIVAYVMQQMNVRYLDVQMQQLTTMMMVIPSMMVLVNSQLILQQILAQKVAQLELFYLGTLLMQTHIIYI